MRCFVDAGSLLSVRFREEGVRTRPLSRLKFTKSKIGCESDGARSNVVGTDSADEAKIGGLAKVQRESNNDGNLVATRAAEPAAIQESRSTADSPQESEMFMVAFARLRTISRSPCKS